MNAKKRTQSASDDERRGTQRALAARLDLDAALQGKATRNDLLPPREDDRVYGELAKRFVEHLRDQLAAGAYVPDPADFVRVPKPGFTSRVAALLSLADRVVYEALVSLIRPALAGFLVPEDIVVWPREQITAKRWREFEQAPNVVEARYVVQADISGFYDSIDHAELTSQLVFATGDRDACSEIRRFLSIVMRGKRGLPQGLIASDALATTFLQPIDAAMVREGFDYWRHGDDIRVATGTFSRAREAIALFEDELRDRGLLINSAKCSIATIETYVGTIEVWTKSAQEAKSQVVAERIRALKGNLDELAAAMDAAQLDNQIGWDLFYHGTISVDDVINHLREHLQPSEVEIAERSFAAALAQSPDSEGGLSKEVFHQRLSASLVRLAAGRSTVALNEIASLSARFPEKTEIFCGYLDAIRELETDGVTQQLENVIDSDRFSTPWQMAWLIRTLEPNISLARSTTIDRLERTAQSEETHWLVRVEAMKALGRLGRLTQKTASHAWRLAPRVYRPDILAAVGRRYHSEDWARRFVSVSHLDPIDKVVATHVRMSSSEPAAQD